MKSFLPYKINDEYTLLGVWTKANDSRRKSLGELGELFAIKALVDNSFERIVNLNDKKMNYPFADLYAEKGGGNFINFSCDI